MSRSPHRRHSTRGEFQKVRSSYVSSPRSEVWNTSDEMRQCSRKSSRYPLSTRGQAKQETGTIDMAPFDSLSHECLYHVPVPSQHVERQSATQVTVKQFSSKEWLTKIDSCRNWWRIAEDQAAGIHARAIRESDLAFFLEGRH